MAWFIVRDGDGQKVSRLFASTIGDLVANLPAGHSAAPEPTAAVEPAIAAPTALPGGED